MKPTLTDLALAGSTMHSRHPTQAWIAGIALLDTQVGGHQFSAFPSWDGRRGGGWLAQAPRPSLQISIGKAKWSGGNVETSLCWTLRFEANPGLSPTELGASLSLTSISRSQAAGCNVSFSPGGGGRRRVGEQGSRESPVVGKYLQKEMSNMLARSRCSKGNRWRVFRRRRVLREEAFSEILISAVPKRSRTRVAALFSETCFIFTSNPIPSMLRIGIGKTPHIAQAFDWPWV